MQERAPYMLKKDNLPDLELSLAVGSPLERKFGPSLNLSYQKDWDANEIR
jgi:hypothetical protein